MRGGAAPYLIIDERCANSSHGCNSSMLFDGADDTVWWGNSFSWNHDGDYLKIQIGSPFRLWRYYGVHHAYEVSMLKISAVSSVGKELTDGIHFKQRQIPVWHNGWFCFLYDAVPGTYIFAKDTTAQFRLDSEWYIESMYADILYEKVLQKLNSVKNNIVTYKK